jgi:hypothetical protein
MCYLRQGSKAQLPLLDSTHIKSLTSLTLFNSLNYPALKGEENKADADFWLPLTFGNGLKVRDLQFGKKFAT